MPCPIIRPLSLYISLNFVLFVLFFEHLYPLFVAQAGLELVIVLLQPLEC